MALTQNKALEQKGAPSAPHQTLIGPLDVKGGVHVFTGAALLYEISTGTVLPALTVANAPSLYRFAGFAESEQDNTNGANGDKKVMVSRGTYMMRNGTGGEALAATHRFGDCYFIDDEVLSNNNAANTRVRAGEFMGFDDLGDPIVAAGLGQ